MNKAYRLLFSSLILLAIAISFVAYVPQGISSAANSSTTISILSPTYATTPESLASYGINSKNVDDFTPFNFNIGTRMVGASFKPDLVGQENRKHIDAQINVDNQVSQFDATNLDVNKLSLQLWINFDSKPKLYTRALTITLQNNDKSFQIKWQLSVDDIQSLITRTELNDYDKNIFGGSSSLDVAIKNTPVGWVKLNLPYKTASVIGDIVSGGKLNITQFTVAQDDLEGADLPISIYGVDLVECALSENANSSEIAPYSAIVIKQSAQVLFAGQKYYKNEVFPQFLSTQDLYIACWVGRTNYLVSPNNAKLKVMTDTGIGSNSRAYYAMGAGDFIIKASSYTVSYGFMYDNKFVGVLTDNFTASNYGKGVWIDSNNDDIEIGKTKKLYFTVHEAFQNSSIVFTSSNEEVLKIIRVDYANNYIEVEAVGKGEATINILINDDRLVGSDLEETGIVNDSFTVEVIKPVKNTNTTKVMLWIALGIMLVGLAVVAVRAIIDVRKINVK